MPGKPKAGAARSTSGGDHAQILGHQRQVGRVGCAAPRNSAWPGAGYQRPRAPCGARPGPPSSRPGRGNDRCAPDRSAAAGARSARARTRNGRAAACSQSYSGLPQSCPSAREVIRRHAGQQRRPAVRVELKLRALRPGRGRIGRHVDRQIAEQDTRRARAHSGAARRHCQSKYHCSMRRRSSSARASRAKLAQRMRVRAIANSDRPLPPGAVEALRPATSNST